MARSPMAQAPRLRIRALWELLRYDMVFATRGFPGIRRGMERGPAWLERSRVQPRVKLVAQETNRVQAAAIRDAVLFAGSFYWKPIRCLQRSVVTARMMRQCGMPAAVMIGVRMTPLMSHAWVEVDGRVVNDAPAYREQLQLLEQL